MVGRSSLFQTKYYDLTDVTYVQSPTFGLRGELGFLLYDLRALRKWVGSQNLVLDYKRSRHITVMPHGTKTHIHLYTKGDRITLANFELKINEPLDEDKGSLERFVVDYIVEKYGSNISAADLKAKGCLKDNMRSSDVDFRSCNCGVPVEFQFDVATKNSKVIIHYDYTLYAIGYCLQRTEDGSQLKLNIEPKYVVSKFGKKDDLVDWTGLLGWFHYPFNTDQITLNYHRFFRGLRSFNEWLSKPCNDLLNRRLSIGHSVRSSFEIFVNLERRKKYVTIRERSNGSRFVPNVATERSGRYSDLVALKGHISKKNKKTKPNYRYVVHYNETHSNVSGDCNTFLR